MRRALRTVRYVGAVLLGLTALYGGYDTVRAFILAPSIDAHDVCPSGETGRCFSSVRGIVDDGGSSYDVKVRYDDGRRTAGLYMLDDEPESGTRVWLEAWNGEFVSVYDSSTETRFRTRDWPLRWDWIGIVLTVLFAVAAVACWPRRRRLFARPQID